MKNLKIEIPEGYVIDEEKSTFENIVFKPKFETHYVDLGLPSGTLWADKNIGAFDCVQLGKHFTFNKAKKYCLPKKWQWEELIEECDWGWSDLFKGYYIKGPKQSIFLPAAGCRIDGSLINDGLNGYYWSRTLYLDQPWGLNFNPNINIIRTIVGNRCSGRSVRTVLNSEND